MAAKVATNVAKRGIKNSEKALDNQQATYTYQFQKRNDMMTSLQESMQLTKEEAKYEDVVQGDLQDSECMADAVANCDKVKPGNGRLWCCLNKNTSTLTDKCKLVHSEKEPKFSALCDPDHGADDDV